MLYFLRSNNERGIAGESVVLCFADDFLTLFNEALHRFALLTPRSFAHLLENFFKPVDLLARHLQVLHEVGLVSMRREGRRAMYRINADGLRTIHDWSSMFARYWRGQLHRIKAHAEEQS